MADRFPLIVDSSTQRVKELASGDNIDLTGSGIVADVFTVDTNSEERLRIDSSGNVGINTTSPSSPLHVNGTSRFEDFIRGHSTANKVYIADDIALSATKKLYLDGGSNTYIHEESADNLEVVTGGTAKLRIDSSGRLLVGTTSAPTCTAMFQGRSDGATNSANLRLAKGSSTPASTDSLGILSFSDSGSQPAAQIQVSRDGGTWSSGSRTPGAMLFMTAPDSASSATEQMRIDSSGRMGLGTTSPQVNVDIAPATSSAILRVHARTDSSPEPAIELVRGAGTSFGGDVYMDYRIRNSVGDLIFERGQSSSTTQALTLDSFGRLLLGTTTEGHADADDLTLQASSGYTGITLRSSTTHGGAIYFSDATSGAGEYDGQIVYNQNSQSFIFATAQTAQMTIDSSGRIGINNTAPGDLYAERLVVDIGSAAQDGITIKSGTSAQCMLAFADGTSGSTAYAGYIDYNHSSNVLSFGTNGGLERMRIDSSGNVKLNGDSPYIYLSDNDNNWIRGSSSLNAILFGSNNTERMRIDSSGRLLLNSGTDVRIELGTTGTTGTNDRNHLRGDGANLKYNTASGGVHVFEQNGSEAARIDSSGRLLVGTISASLTNKFLLQGDTGSANNGGYMRLQTANSIVAGTGLGAIGFGDSANNGALIEASGDVSWSPFTKGSRLEFATTADGASSPTVRVRINNQGDHFSYGNTNNVLARVGTTGTGGWIYWGAYGATSISSGTQSFGVYANGNVVNTSNSYGPLSSDERLKQDITNANSQWDDIKNIRITNFHYKNDPTGHLHIGPIAQELEQVSPGLVTRRSVSEEEIADSSNDLTDGDEVLSFKASILYMKAVKALQEAMERIETLEAKVAALEAG